MSKAQDETLLAQEDVSLKQFMNSDHFKISQMAQPILDKLQAFMPPSISLDDGLKFELIPRGERLKGQITYYYKRHNLSCYDYKIRLHRALMSPLVKEEATEVLSHELAHYAALKWKGFNERGHGYYWGYFMICLGYEPSKYVPRSNAQAMREAEKLESQDPFKMLDCSGCGKEVIAELKDYVYHCPDCNIPIS